ncbi:hypothetical protein KL905_001621 [Ogataea polymorpha]|nr:hypothetical protein KL937_000092 [Ogataea polymorpha]KAG7889646.1 hypothetical protein KL908_004759 [Ogataea polymorpha]KAG7895605.1 hypothetical protein KL936_000313 [Ogataea polymorpha]KAG7904319.1 hypothetical protein KL935_000458 [Ogataea polymorpha]KAG7905928.1 hypothetical protein KL906_004998 [Ogataea polymorpha]
MVDPNFVQQLNHSKQIRAKNSHLSQKYSKYLSKTLAKLVAPDSAETGLQSKVETIYSNQESIARQKDELVNTYQQLGTKAMELHKKLEKTTKRLHDSGANTAQGKIELLDRNIRVLENSIKLVESTNTRPAPVNKGLFG